MNELFGAQQLRKYPFVITPELRKRFWDRVDQTDGLGPKGDCWHFIGASRGVGYGAFKVKAGLVIDAHRLAWMLYNRIEGVPSGHDICHRCDNRQCVKPDHLFVGTRSENMIDAREKGRLNHRHGRQIPTATLTDEMVSDGRRRFTAGETYKAIAESYGVDCETLRKALRGEAWKHVTDPPPVTAWRVKRRAS